MYAGGAAAAVLDIVYLVHHNYDLTWPTVHPFPLGVMAVITALGAASFIGAVIATLVTLWSDYGVNMLTGVGSACGSLFSFGSKVLLGVWGIAITAAVAFLVAKTLGYNIPLGQ